MSSSCTRCNQTYWCTQGMLPGYHLACNHGYFGALLRAAVAKNNHLHLLQGLRYAQP